MRLHFSRRGLRFHFRFEVREDDMQRLSRLTLRINPIFAAFLLIAFLSAITLASEKPTSFHSGQRWNRSAGKADS